MLWEQLADLEWIITPAKKQIVDIAVSNIKIWQNLRSAISKLFKQLKVTSKDQISTILRALDKIDRLGWDEAKKLLGEGRKDKSGDYTKGANLNNGQIKIIEDSLNSKNSNSEDVEEIIKIFQNISMIKGFDV